MKHSDDTISVTVEYQLAEYKRMVFDVIPLHLATLRKPPVLVGGVFVALAYWVMHHSTIAKH